MIRLLKGTIESKTERFVILDVGGVGYQINTSSKTLNDLKLGQAAKIFCHLYVREDALELYGFLSAEELAFFELLIGISGIGPRAALSILSLASVAKLKQAIASGEEIFLTKVSGIGRKIAQKIILELKDKLPQIDEQTKVGLKDELEAIEALVGLGYKEQEAKELVRKISQTVQGAENIIKEALKNLGQ